MIYRVQRVVVARPPARESVRRKPRRRKRAIVDTSRRGDMRAANGRTTFYVSFFIRFDLHGYYNNIIIPFARRRSINDNNAALCTRFCIPKPPQYIYIYTAGAGLRARISRIILNDSVIFDVRVCVYIYI